MLLTNNQNVSSRFPLLDTPLYILSNERPQLRKVGTAGNINIQKNKVSFDGRFNIEVIPPYKSYCLFTSSLPNQDNRPVVIISNITGPSFPPDSQFIPFIQGNLIKIYRVNSWKTIEGMNPFEVARKLNNHKFEDLLNASDLEEIPFN